MNTLIEAAALLGVTAATLRQQIANGRLKGRKVGRDWTISAREVERYRTKRCRATGHRGVRQNGYTVCPVCGDTV